MSRYIATLSQSDDALDGPDAFQLRSVEDPINIMHSVTSQQDETFSEICFSPVEDLLAVVTSTTSGWGTRSWVRIWNVDTRLYTDKVFSENDIVQCISFSPDGKALAVKIPCEIIIWSLSSGQPIQSIANNTTSGSSECCFSFDGSRILTSFFVPGEVYETEGGGHTFRENRLGVWDTISGNIQHTVEFLENDIGALSVSPASNIFAVCLSELSYIRVLDVDSAGVVATLTGHDDGIANFCFTVHGERLASSSYDGTVKLWSTDSWSLLQTIVCEGYWLMVKFNDEGTKLLGGRSENIEVYDILSGEVTQIPDVVYDIGCFSHSGVTLLL
jgi:WD40 repeat protein